MQASPLDLNDSSMPRFEWPLLSPSTDTTASLSPSKEKQLTDRIQNLELMVGNLLTRIVELEKTKYENEKKAMNEFREWQKEIREKKMKEIKRREEAGEKPINYFDLNEDDTT